MYGEMGRKLAKFFYPGNWTRHIFCKMLGSQVVIFSVGGCKFWCHFFQIGWPFVRVVLRDFMLRFEQYTRLHGVL
jgi:hypothetical protein